ncbi:permease prefix domain 1-containing protein [Paenibacillus faecis]|uniref:permease prefix domain 1-containing protein n=1 Tax=Paenibacillus faecis TaxID=862114 RepID=UPI001BCFD89C|nr:permease prefix domain 1-containing protein [Paenibacillus faecis]
MMKTMSLTTESTRRITEYVDQLCRLMKEPPGEINDFREEMTANLISGVLEHMQTGIDEQQAVTMALSQFGEAGEVKRELEKIYTVKRRFATGVLSSALTLLVLSAVCIGLICGVWNERMVEKFAEDAYQIVKQESGTPGTTTLSQPLQEKLKAWVDNTWGVKGINIERAQYKKNENPRLFRYAADSDAEQWLNYGSNYESYSFTSLMEAEGTEETERPRPESNFFIKTAIRDVSSSYVENPQSQVVDENSFIVSVAAIYFNYTFFYSLGLFLLGGYCLLFTVWAGMNAYYEGKGNIGWIALFLLTNIIGYGLYLLSRGSKRRGAVAL